MLLGSSIVGASAPCILLALGGPTGGGFSQALPLTLTATGTATTPVLGVFDQTFPLTLGASGSSGFATVLRDMAVSTTNTTTYPGLAIPTSRGDAIVVEFSGDTAAINAMTITCDCTQHLEYVKIADFTATGNARRNIIWLSKLTAEAGTVTATVTSSGTLTGATVATRTVQGFPVFVQSATGSGSGTTPSMTFGAAVGTGSIVIGMVQSGNNPAALTPPTSYTEDADTGFGTPAHGIESVHRNSGETGTTVTWGASTTGVWVALGVELAQGTRASIGHRIQYGPDATWNVLRIYQPTADPRNVITANGDRPVQFMSAHNQWGYAGTDVPNPNVAWQDTFAHGCAGVFWTWRKHEDAAYPAPLQDEHLAAQWIIANASLYKLDLTRNGAFGISAGAHMLASLTLTGGESSVGGAATTVAFLKAVYWQFGHNRCRLIDPAFTALSLTRSVTACCNAGPPWSIEANTLGSDASPLQPCAQASFDWVSGDGGSLDNTTSAVYNLFTPGWWATRFPAGTHKPLFNCWHGTADTSIPYFCTHNPKTLGTGHALDNGFVEDLIAAGWTSQQAVYTLVAGGTHNGDEFLPSSNPNSTNGAAVDAAVQWLLAASQVYMVGTFVQSLPLTLTATGLVTAINCTFSQSLPLTLAAAGSVEMRGTFAQAFPLTLTATGTAATPIFGTFAQALPLSLSATGSIEIRGTFAQTLPLTLVASGSVENRGTFAQTVPLTLTAAGILGQAITGAFSQTLPLTLTASGTSELGFRYLAFSPAAGGVTPRFAVSAHTAFASGRMPFFRMSSAALGSLAAIFDQTFPLTLAATGSVEMRGAFAQALPLALTATGVVTPSSLPALARQGPLWGVGDVLMAATAAGSSYTDPVSGADVLRVTDATVSGMASNGSHEYASMTEIASHPWTSGPDTFISVVYFNPDNGSTRLCDINVATRAISNRRTGPTGAAASRLHLCFSTNPATPRILYYLGGTRESTIIRYDTATNAAAPSGHFPKDCSASTTSTFHEQLQVSQDERWYAFQDNVSGNHNYVIAYDDTTDTINKKVDADWTAACPASPTTGYWNGQDEFHLRRDGNGLFVGGADSGSGGNLRHPIVYWNFGTGVVTPGHTGSQGIPGVVHTDGIDDRWITNCTGIGGLNGYYTFDIEANTRTQILTHANSTDGAVHCSSHFKTPGATTDAQRWFGTTPTQDGVIQNWNNLTWTLHTGTPGTNAVYKTTPAYRFSQTSARMASGGLVWQTLTGNTASWRAVLTQRGSVGEVQATAGSWYHDATPNTLYCRPLDDLDISGATYKNHIGVVCPNALCEGVGLFRLDGSGGVLVAHHYTTAHTIPLTYYGNPRGQLMQNGLGYIFTSNMNVLGGRTDCFIAFFPDGVLT